MTRPIRPDDDEKTPRPDPLHESWARQRAKVADADGRVPPGWEPTGTRHNPHWANND